MGSGSSDTQVIFRSPSLELQQLATAFLLPRVCHFAEINRAYLVEVQRGSTMHSSILMGIETTCSDTSGLMALVERLCTAFQQECPTVCFEGVLSLSTLPDVPESRKREILRVARCIFEKGCTEQKEARDG